MTTIAQIQRAPLASFVSESTRFSIGMLTLPQKLAMTLAMVTTLVSLAMAMLNGWQSGGLLAERVIRIALVGVAVLFVHWLPVGWSLFRGVARYAAIALWTVATAVVLYGQVSYFVISQQHAGDLRAATVPTPSVSASTNLPPGRLRTEIAKEAAKVSTDLARAQAAKCIDDCPALKVRRVRLAAEIAALNVEADEAKRREAIEDRRNAQADHADELRKMSRVDPVAFLVASWLGTTDHRVELIIGLAYAVVLEGAAIIGWLMVSVAWGRAAVVFDRETVRSDLAGSRETAVSGRDGEAPERVAVASGRMAASDENAASPVTPKDELGLKKIQEAVLTGHIKPTQKAIRTLLRCGQRKAGSLSRQFHAHYGSMCRHGGDVQASAATKPAVADP